MTYRVVIEATAERQIRAAVRWKTENASPTAAARWYNGLLKKVATLRTRPTRYPVAAESDEFPIESMNSSTAVAVTYSGSSLRSTAIPFPSCSCIMAPGRGLNPEPAAPPWME